MCEPLNVRYCVQKGLTVWLCMCYDIITLRRARCITFDKTGNTLDAIQVGWLRLFQKNLKKLLTGLDCCGIIIKLSLGSNNAKNSFKKFQKNS